MDHTNNLPIPTATELTVGQLAERSGVNVSALHFYERQGLIASRRGGAVTPTYQFWRPALLPLPSPDMSPKKPDSFMKPKFHEPPMFHTVMSMLQAASRQSVTP